MKRILALSLTVLLVFGSVTVVCADSASVSDYSAYIEQSFSVPENDIEITGTDYSAVSGAEVAVDDVFFGKRVLRWENESGSVFYSFSSAEDANYYLRLF